MRNPERLDKFYGELCKIHKTYFPDWREFQLFYNMFSEMTEDPFFWETDKGLEFIKDYAKKYGKKSEKGEI